jgi:hypothetical protein
MKIDVYSWPVTEAVVFGPSPAIAPKVGFNVGTVAGRERSRLSVRFDKDWWSYHPFQNIRG